MATDTKCQSLLLVYDGDCPMCTAAVAWLERTGLVAAEQIVSNHELAPEQLTAAQAAGIRNRLVVLDARSGATRSGADGLVWLVGENRAYPLWVKFLALPVVRQVVRIVYEAVSYNRRIISPPRHAIRCDCEPQATVARRLMLVGPLGVLAVGLVGLFGAAVWHALGRAETMGAAIAIAAVGAGWLALGGAAVVLQRGERRVDYLAHLAYTAFVGSLALLPMGVVGWWMSHTASVALGGASLLAAYVVMLRMQTRRVAAVGLSPHWLRSWGCVTAASFIAMTIATFYPS